MAHPKSDLPLVTSILRFFDSFFEPRPRTDSPHAAGKPTQAATTAPPPCSGVVISAYTLAPLAQFSGSSSADPLDLRYDLGLAVLRRTSLQEENGEPHNSSSSCSSSNRSSTLSIAIPRVMSLSPPSPQRSRKLLSDAATGKPQWLQQLPRLSAEHQRLFSRVQKLQLKASLDLSSNKYSAEAVWFAKLEGQPARLKCKWSEGSPNELLFDAAVAVRGPSHKLRLTGQPHQLQTASLMLRPTAKPSGNSSSSSSTPDAAARLDVSPLTVSSSSNIEDAAAAEQPVSRAFDQPGLQVELGYNFAGGTPILVASRRFSNSSSSSAAGGIDSSSSRMSSSWRLQQVKAAYDGKSNNMTLSAAGAAWNLGVVLPTEATGPLGLPKLPRGGSGWPRLVLSLQPDVSFDAL